MKKLIYITHPVMTDSIYTLKIFEGIEVETIKNILLESNQKNFPKGKIIMMEGEDSNGEGYIIKSGTVEVNIGTKKVTELGTGEIFGEIALLNEEKRTATVTAIKDTTVIILTFENLIKMLKNKNSKINKEIIKRIEQNIENEE